MESRKAQSWVLCFFSFMLTIWLGLLENLDFVLFADDTNIFAQDRNPAELFGRVNRGLGELSRWFRCNRLTLNLPYSVHLIPCALFHLPHSVRLILCVLLNAPYSVHFVRVSYSVRLIKV